MSIGELLWRSAWEPGRDCTRLASSSASFARCSIIWRIWLTRLLEAPAKDDDVAASDEDAAAAASDESAEAGVDGPAATTGSEEARRGGCEDTAAAAAAAAAGLLLLLAAAGAEALGEGEEAAGFVAVGP